ncbi:hypothetical protein B0T26DRAFT_749256 [Lasiosphaeria miniovina]|uniref:Uncharacterized protein n=1 Tax=Lasiosphaeria miniovina TaxID=1954250 RepID=A0AA40ATK4_9PEZI|nr:uncharacterized protein B0T26DRAFT_749256 [Lasiosphaeria miniovina]KAK0721771.1 hypothetical protein B0T26DRAFT_749256 [Lasiosphaeria miniovina]
MASSDSEGCSMCTTYYFARPAQNQHAFTPQLRPRLVTQMQQFDAWGRLQETVDLFSVGFLTSRLRRDIRSFVTENNPPPNLIMTREMIRSAQNGAPGKDEPEAALAGAAAWEMHRCRVAGASHAAIFWTDGRCWKAIRNGEGMYSITEDSATETRWSWTRSTQDSRELELKAANTAPALALLTPGSPGTLRVL